MRLLLFLGMICVWTGVAGFVSREVSVENPTEGAHFSGTLTMPDNGNPRAALVLATGSGAQDRDETVYGHKPFKVIAESLSDAGYAVLRLDDRGVGGSTGPTENATTANFVSDIRRAVEWTDSVLPNVPIGVLGHSEGGQIAYRAASSDPKCRFIITLAAPAWRGDSLVMAQCRALMMNSLGRWDGEQNQRRILEVVRSSLPPITARPIIMAEIAKSMGNAATMPQMQEYINVQAEIVLVPWYRDFVRYDPTEDIKTISVPWLALNGDKDTQVPVNNLVTIKELCKTADTIVLPDHNHLFQHAATGLPNEYEQIEEDISAETIKVIIEWLDDKM